MSNRAPGFTLSAVMHWRDSCINKLHFRQSLFSTILYTHQMSSQNTDQPTRFINVVFSRRHDVYTRVWTVSCRTLCTQNAFQTAPSGIRNLNQIIIILTNGCPTLQLMFDMSPLAIWMANSSRFACAASGSHMVLLAELLVCQFVCQVSWSFWYWLLVKCQSKTTRERTRAAKREVTNRFKTQTWRLRLLTCGSIVIQKASIL